METQKMIYAGFWKRVLAHIIDQIIISIISFFLIMPLLMIFGIGIFSAFGLDDVEYYSLVVDRPFGDDLTIAGLTALVFSIILIVILVNVVQWLYYAIFESSNKQATAGKMILNLKVTDTAGNKISFGRATGRYFGKILSSLILYIGFIMIAFTEKKQGLHDILAGCLVLDTSAEKLFLTNQYKT